MNVFLYGFSIWWVILPLFAAQYALAIFCLTRLALCNISIKKYMVWNLVCLLVFFVGSFTFLIYYYKNKSKLTAPPPQTHDILINDIIENKDEIIENKEVENEIENKNENIEKTEHKNDEQKKDDL